jgi:uncharacterized membrane protein
MLHIQIININIWNAGHQKRQMANKGLWGDLLFTLLWMAIIAALGIMGYILSTPQVVDKTDEFYVLRIDQTTGSYPKELKSGVESRVILGIVNHEGKGMTYRIVTKMEQHIIKEIGPLVLENGEKWEEEVGFIPVELGNNLKIEFSLYRNDETEPAFQPLYLWVNVTE